MADHYESPQLLTVNQVAAACGVGRSTILRLEKEGFISPTAKGEGGYRYYNSHTLSAILQVLSLQSMGLTRKEMAASLRQDSVDDMLEKLEEKLDHLRRQVQKMRAIRDPGMHLRIGRDRSPSNCMYIQPIPSPFPITPGFHRNFEDCLLAAARGGYPINWNGAVSLISRQPEPLLKGILDEHSQYYAGILLRKEVRDENTVIWPASRVLSILCYGGYESIPLALVKLGSELARYNCAPTGPLRFISIRGPHQGDNIPPEKYVTEIRVSADLPDRD